MLPRLPRDWSTSTPTLSALGSKRRAAHRFFTPRLSLIFSDKSRTVAERMLATQALAVYLAGDPARLAELLLVAEPDQFLSLFPVAETRKSEVLPVLKAQLTETNTPSWNDPALDASWTKPDSALKRTIESAHGLLDDRFAFCQTMGLDDCRELSEKLRESGYRLVRFRPFADGKSVKVAAVWSRDGRKWKLESELSSDEVSLLDQQYRSQKFLPVDVAGYVRTSGDGKRSDRYTALWVESTSEGTLEIFAGLDRGRANLKIDQLMSEDLNPRTAQSMKGADGGLRICGIWGRLPADDVSAQASQDLFEANFHLLTESRKDRVVGDVSVCEAGRVGTVSEHALAALEDIDKTLTFEPDDLEARLTRAIGTSGLVRIRTRSMTCESRSARTRNP